MNIRELKEIIEKRKEEILEGNYSYNFYSEMISNWKFLVGFLESNYYDYTKESKEKFLIYMKDIKPDKTYLNTIHSLEALVRLDILKKNRFTARLQRSCKKYDFGEYHNKIIREYIEECSEYNSRRTISEKNYIIIKITEFFLSRGIKQYSDLSASDVIAFRSFYLNMNAKSNKKSRQKGENPNQINFLDLLF